MECYRFTVHIRGVLDRTLKFPDETRGQVE